jgi:heme exporter protein A
MNPPTAPVIVAKGLERRFGSVVALRSVSLTVHAGEVVLLAGPNGAGKSTLLRTIAGLVRPTRGTVHIGGHELRREPAARSAIGFLSHQTFLYDDLTARENLRFAATLHGLDSVEERVRDALDAAGLAQRAEARAAVLSHGTKQRLSIARATLHDPAALLLDEPFNGLDAAAVRRLCTGLGADAARGRAVVCVTHQPADLWQIATRVVLLNRGSVVFDTPRHESLDEFHHSCDRALAA